MAAWWRRRRLTVVAGQAPAGGHAGHARGEDVGGLGQADGGDGGAQAGGRGQLDEADVIVDGARVPLGVGEHLRAAEEEIVHLSFFPHNIDKCPAQVKELNKLTSKQKQQQSFHFIINKSK